ncbi:MAG TPA: amidase [Ornithinimicrobium sp.]|uniref:amidase n=1 Tax=Ornithinimicrobium sp. TaxID=1977084 RepID=UPI002B48F9C6|nr:amidase [Ornithinimicrobium sp.]HKJ12774.1 amidase [Ornithinimicrobium sp.]
MHTADRAAGHAEATSDEVAKRDRPEGLHHLTAVQLAQLVAAREVSATDVVAAHLEHLDEVNPRLNAFTLIDADGALRAAGALDATLRHRFSRPGSLAGVPFVVKDNIDVSGQVTACGSLAHDGALAAMDAPVVRRLVDRGAILLGRANMDELAMGASTQTSAYGPTRNPVDPRRSPGGSSGGCAAAVAAHVTPIAVGTDTGGSIREPASQCGVVGMASSPGLVPMYGVAPFARGLDRAGPLARNIGDTRAALSAMAGGLTPASPVRQVGVIRELLSERNRPDVLEPFRAWLDVLARHGVEVCEVSVPDAPHALDAYMVLTSVAALEWLAPWVRTGRAGEELTRRHEYAEQVRDADPGALQQADERRRRLTAQMRDALRRCPVLVSPTMPTTAPLLHGEVSAEDLADPLAAPYTDCWTVVANLTGLPALSVPAPTTGLPTGAMLMGSPGTDAALLQLAGRCG